MGDPDAPPLNLARLLRTLVDHGVEFIVIVVVVVVGGAGAVAHGATRPTTDLDVVLRWTTENLKRAAGVLAELSARLKVPGVMEPIEVPLDARMLNGMELSTWRTAAGDFDLISHLPHGKHVYLRYEDLLSRAEQVMMFGVSVNLATLDDIITSKETVDRPPDREALPELYRLRSDRLAGTAPRGPASERQERQPDQRDFRWPRRRPPEAPGAGSRAVRRSARKASPAVLSYPQPPAHLGSRPSRRRPPPATLFDEGPNPRQGPGWTRRGQR